MTPEVTQEEAEEAVRTLLLWAGDDVSREGLRDTPSRVARMYREVFGGLRVDKPKLTAFSSAADQMVVVGNIAFSSMCEHHLVPFMGRIDIGYIPQGRVLGLSKFARIVDWFASRPQIQEQLTEQIADALYEELFKAEEVGDGGIIVVARAEHMCMSIRGVKKPGHVTTTSAIRGNIDKTEFFALLGLRDA